MTNLPILLTIFPKLSKSTLGSILFLVLTLFGLSVRAQNPVQYPVVRENGGEITAEGTDIGAVQNYTGAADGDVIKVRNGATFNTSVPYPVDNFTVESASEEIVNISVQAGYGYANNATFKNINFTSADNYSGSFMSSLSNITFIGNVSFSAFDNSENNSSHVFIGNESTLTFSGNSSTTRGGAIGQLYELRGSNNTLVFSNNSSKDCGGAIGSLSSFEINNNTMIFNNNHADCDGGAIGSMWIFDGNNNVLTFSGNTSGGNGGAIYETFRIQWSGKNTFKFTGNTAAGRGNDIYLENNVDLLEFNDGTYYFDGGIWHTGGYTEIKNGAEVTIAGRNDNSVNEYELQVTTLEAKLTAELDDIESLHGWFTVGENGLLTLNKGAKAATVVSTDNNANFELLYEARGNVTEESLVVSSGRIDIKGCMDASIELKHGQYQSNQTFFSPGNSAGRLETTGDFKAVDATLIFEKEGAVYDQLIAHDVIVDPGVKIELVDFTYAPGTIYDIIIANGTLSITDEQTWMDMILDGLPEDVELMIYNGNTVRLFVPAEPVPEPSTWTLLILGAASLMYWRKRQ